MGSSQALRDARRYEEILEKVIGPLQRPLFHLTPRAGWMNDPNGFCRFGGRYHLFYQYYPYASHWDSMHWGHAVSTDLLHWEYLPAALAPDEWYDQNGCFSGSALETEDGRLMLMYTGVRLETLPNGKKKEVQTQCIAVGDGIDFEKYAGNPVLTEEELPAGGSRFDFRDPKMWRGADGLIYSAIGNRPADGSGQILLYKSADGLSWQYDRVLAANNNRYGKMWECPDFFELDGKQILLVSPQDMLPEGFEYHNGNGTLCVIGQYDEETRTFTEEANQAVDYGIDFYAPQTVLAEDGRRIMIGWMQNWDACAIREPEEPWSGQMSMPRELYLKDGRLYQRPVREIEDMRCDPVAVCDEVISGRVDLPGISGRCVDLTVRIRPKEGSSLYHKVAVRFAENETFRTSVSYRPHEATLKIDRKFSGSRRAIIHQRRALVEESRDGEITLRIILDRFSAEIFVNDGRQVLSAVVNTDPAADGISFYADGEAVIDVVKYTLR
ncbi:MAG: glycoside hydrolase family 32 protein [Lachnospiraceae bacterium]|nr:glycoside hydrolase family 32 protein [Lachnospiraceae bacterium]